MTSQTIARILMLGSSGPASRVLAVPNEPSYHLGAVDHRALVRCGYEVEMLQPRGRKLAAEAVHFAARIRGARLVVASQGCPCLAACLATLGRRWPRLIMHTWKVPFIGPSHFTGRLNDLILQRVIRRSSLTIVNSYEQERLLKERYPNVPTLWLPMAADTDWWGPGVPQTDVLARIGRSVGDFLLCVGDVDRDERVPAELAKRLGRPLVRVTRDPRTAERAMQVAREIGLKDAHTLRGIPWVELRDLYRSAWLLLTAPKISYHPAGLTTITEAMACGAVVAFPNISTAEGYIQHGVNGLLFEKMTVDDLLATISGLDRPGVRERLSAAALATCGQSLNFHAATEMMAAKMKDLGLDAATLCGR